ncbi:spermidine/putrescine transport system substrate-binding protein [Halopelagius inordinatus]|uniref:Spermidine/putrescine transport system substrate-binding protein n=1 Tax=Halopelagius inordinatus TaxID=553467 RepID=A0A1I2SER7_9EURY|nr:spermidine/putrescine ABC transporter substrate-binding protein [Halopelagius inordinatus]SFG48531.1 spermidine/putrescine transport system substrate-binding protein [Halopelagius inordinatus]
MPQNEPRRSNRRSFLKRTGAVSVGIAGLAGCTGGGGSGDESDGGGSDGGKSTDGGSNGELEQTLNIFQWTDYWPDGFISGFEEETGVNVSVSNFASNEEMFNALKAGGTEQYDLIFPSDYMVNVMVDQEMIRPLNLDAIPNFSNLSGRFEEAPYDPGEKRYSAPYQWGTSGIAYNENMTESVDTSSWEVMWNGDYAGQMTMLDDMRETIGAALKHLGYSLNTKNEDEIREAKELLIQQKELLKTYDSANFPTNLINEQASPVHAWSGGAFQAYWETWKEGEGSPIHYSVPKEGGVVWVDTAAVTKEASHPNAAHAFINYFLDAEHGAEITNYTYYGSPNEAAKEHIADEILENESIYPSDETMSNLEFIQNLGQATTVYDSAWQEIKSA